MKSSTSNHSGTRLFFIEFLIVLFFFLIISTVCLRLFVQSHSMTKHTEELFQAQEAAASVAELLEAGGDSVSVLLTAYPEAVLDDSGLDPVITICFDHISTAVLQKKKVIHLPYPLLWITMRKVQRSPSANPPAK